MIDGKGEIIILTTVADPSHAETFSRRLVERKLAACVTCIPGATSFYHWDQEGVTRDSEHLLLIKTHQDRLDDIQRYFEDEHPYELPEFLVLEISQLSRAYRDWMLRETSGQ